jgi:hypothetical protein
VQFWNTIGAMCSAKVTGPGADARALAALAEEINASKDAQERVT